MTTSRNEAAERLRVGLREHREPETEMELILLDAALDAAYQQGRREALKEVERGLKSERQTVQVRAILTSVRAIAGADR